MQNFRQILGNHIDLGSLVLDHNPTVLDLHNSGGNIHCPYIQINQNYIKCFVSSSPNPKYAGHANGTGECGSESVFVEALGDLEQDVDGGD